MLRAAFAVLSLFILPSFTIAKGRPIVLDVDPGIDDAIAILLAVRSPELDLRAVTVVFGNVELDLGVTNALKILELAGRTDIPVARGAEAPLVAQPLTAKNVHGENGLGNAVLPDPAAKLYPGSALRLMAETLSASPEPVTLVPVGPLTNIAIFLKAYPELRPKIREIVSMGGTAAEVGTVKPMVSFNILNDPEAAAIVYRSGLPVTMVGLDVTLETVLTPEHTRRFAGSTAAVARFVDAVVRFHGEVRDADGLVVHDALAVGTLIDPTFVRTEALPVDIELAGDLTRGMTVVDRRADRTWKDAAPVSTRVSLEVDAERFLSLLLDRLSQSGS
jgi:pyrimidine-specific ribonucleoside hydrolase